MKLTNLSRMTVRFQPVRARAVGGAATSVCPCAPPLPLAAGTRRCAGISLIEFIGVLAIISILAAAVVGGVVTDMTGSQVTTEAANLASMNQALVAEVLHTYQIPGANNWATNLGSWLMLPSTQIATNAVGFKRVFLYDSTGFGSISLPYTQAGGVTTFPANPRIMIISSLDGNIPDTSGGTNSAEFNAVWNTTAGSLPSTWTTWATNHTVSASRLLIQRINLLPLFKQVILSAVDTNDFGGFTVQSGSVANTTSAQYVQRYSATNCWYLLGTVIGLYDTNYNASLGTCGLNLESQYVVQGDISFVFEDQAWRGLLTGWGTNGPAGLYAASSSSSNVVTAAAAAVVAAATPASYATCAHGFKQCSTNWRDNNGGDCCESCQACFDDLMSHYNSWCQQGFPVNNNNSCATSYVLGQDCSKINNLTWNMCQ